MRLAALLGLALLSITAWGCGGKTTTVTGPDGEKATVSQQGDNVEVTVRGKDGEKATYSSGRSVALPEGFPKDVPLYPGAKVTMSGKQGEGMMVMLTSGDDVQKIAGFYEAKLKENGWEIETSANIGEGSMFAAKKEKRHLSVGINPGQITLVVNEQ
jgi:hypothetical protein